MGEFELIWSRWKLDDWDAVTEEHAYEIFHELVAVSLESEFDRQVLLDPKMNTVALGVCKSETYLVLVILISVKMLTILKVGETDNQEVEIRGRMLNPDYGPFCCQLHFMENGNKHGQIISFENTSYSPETQEFVIIYQENGNVWQPPKYFEIYLKENPAMIPYLKRDKKLSRIPLGQLAKGIRWPLTIYPHKRQLLEDERDRFKRENELEARRQNQDMMKRKREEELQEKKLDREQLKAENELRRQQGEDVESLEDGSEKGSRDERSKHSEDEEEKKLNLNLEENSMSGDGSMSDSMSQDKGNKDAKEQSISNKEIRLELEAAISEAKRELDILQTENLSLQAKIIDLRKDNPNISDKQSDVTMSDIKYANTLAHVHQIRMDLKQTQDRYKTMADNLQKKLEEKTQKCNEIKLAFMELKREVCKKAAFARSGKPIPEKLILEWEEREYGKSKELQLLRLEILKFRNTQAKLQKSMKKKEEFINGLHLIDYEQLKIENQSLNEKIEDRNEELHKLRRKNTQTVQILTHIKEKLQFEQKENDALEEKAKSLLEINKNQKKRIKHLKEKKSFYEADVKSLKQETGIINSKNLTNDFVNREKNIKDLRDKKFELNVSHSRVSFESV